MSRILRIPTTVLLLLSAATGAEAQRVTITGTVKYEGPQLKTELPVADDARQYCGSTIRSAARCGVSAQSYSTSGRVPHPHRRKTQAARKQCSG